MSKRKIILILIAVIAFIVYNRFPEFSSSVSGNPGIHTSKTVITDDKTASVSGQPEKNPRNERQKLEMPAPLQGIPEIIVEHTGFTVSFNCEHNNPNYVAWELTAEETEGRELRSDFFLPDPEIPEPHRVVHSDYTGCGYDRGHMAPAADMKWSPTAMQECFYMSNICPQDHDFNSGAWQRLESSCRRWAKQEGKVYIVCGPVYNLAGDQKKIGYEHKISVPEGFFKVVMSLRSGHEKAIGFYYKNDNRRQTMESAAMSVDDIEKLTGMDFFANVERKTEKRIEASYSLRSWN